QRGFRIRADPDDPSLYAWTEKRNPNPATTEQSPPPHSGRASGMHQTIKFHLFHCRQCPIHTTSLRCFSVAFLHLRLKRVAAWFWMWFFPTRRPSHGALSLCQSPRDEGLGGARHLY